MWLQPRCDRIPPIKLQVAQRKQNSTINGQHTTNPQRREEGATQGRQEWQKDLLLLSWHKDTSWWMYTWKWTRIGPLQRTDRETQGMPARWRLHRQIKLGLAPVLSHTPSLCYKRSLAAKRNWKLSSFETRLFGKIVSLWADRQTKQTGFTLL